MNTRRLARLGIPTALLLAGRRRWLPRAALVGYWGAVYAAYRRQSIDETRREWELLRDASREAYARHYNEAIITIDEELDLWGDFHRHRHEMRYDLVADLARRHLPTGGTLLDVGCGSALVVDRLTDVDATYVGLDFPARNLKYAADREHAGRLRPVWVRGDGERLPLRDETVDVVVLSEVIEHLMRPEGAVWEIARVLRPGGALVMTTNNASEVPLRSPLSHALAWVEKAVGWDRPHVISRRPWVWPEPVEHDPPVYVPHTHHIQAETRALFAAAGLDTAHASSFEFPPPQSGLAQRLDAMGERGRRAVDVVEAVAKRTPGLRRMGAHVLMVAVKRRPPVEPTPPPDVWPGPFSGAAGRSDT